MPISPKDMKRIMASPHRILGPVERHVIQENDSKTSKRDTEHLHPSEICKKDWCPRSSYYKIIGMPEKPESFNLQRLNVFAMGTMIHEKWQKWMEDAGILEQAEVPVYNEEHLIMGHADGIVSDKHGRAVVEIKSVGAGTIRFEDYGLFAPYAKKEITFEALWESIKQPFDSHVRQAQLYMYCLGVDKGLILYEWKATQEVKEFQIDYQPELVDPILASCLTVKRALEAKEPPSRPSWLTPESKTCKYCPFKEECWNENSREVDTWGAGVAGEVQPQVRVAEQAVELDSRDAPQPRRVVR